MPDIQFIFVTFVLTEQLASCPRWRRFKGARCCNPYFVNLVLFFGMLQVRTALCHNNMKFTIEFEQDNEIPFFDILVTLSRHPSTERKCSQVTTRNGIRSLHESTK